MNLIKNILTISVVAGILVLHPSLNKGDTPITYLQYLVYGNSFNLDLSPTINKEQVSVVWVNHMKEELVLVKRGKKINDIPYKEGEQQLVVYYQNRLIGKIEQNKSSKLQSHQYNLKLSSKNNTVFFNGEIIGPASYKSPLITIPHIASL